MSDKEFEATMYQLPEGENPHTVLTFGNGATLKVTIEMEGDWSNVFDFAGEVTPPESQIKGGFATEFFARIGGMFQ